MMSSPASSVSSAPPQLARFKQRRRTHRTLYKQEHALFAYTARKVEDAPDGYPRLAAFLASDRRFTLFRKFGYLRSRCLLEKQDELAELEEKLSKLDTHDTEAFNLSSRRKDLNPERRKLLREVTLKLGEYDTLLEAYMKLQERTTPGPAIVSSVRNWIQGTKPVVLEEQSFLCDWEDLVCPAIPLDHGGLDSLLGWLSSKLPGPASSSNTSSKADDPNIQYTDSVKLSVVARWIVMVSAVAILTVPILVLYMISSIAWRLLAVSLFTLIFSSLLTGLTRSRNFDIFAVTAAYCAVMVVFVGGLPLSPCDNNNTR